MSPHATLGHEPGILGPLCPPISSKAMARLAWLMWPLGHSSVGYWLDLVRFWTLTIRCAILLWHGLCVVKRPAACTHRYHHTGPRVGGGWQEVPFLWCRSIGPSTVSKSSQPKQVACQGRGFLSSEYSSPALAPPSSHGPRFLLLPLPPSSKLKPKLDCSLAHSLTSRNSR